MLTGQPGSAGLHLSSRYVLFPLWPASGQPKVAITGPANSSSDWARPYQSSLQWPGSGPERLIPPSLIHVQETMCMCLFVNSQNAMCGVMELCLWQVTSFIKAYITWSSSKKYFLINLHYEQQPTSIFTAGQRTAAGFQAADHIVLRGGSCNHGKKLFVCLIVFFLLESIL